MKLTRFFALMCAAVVAFVGCEPVGEPDGGNATSATLSADKETACVGEVITFTVKDQDGNDITASSKIFDKNNGHKQVENPFTPEADGVYEFYATSGSALSNTISVGVVPAIPELPADAEPSNTSFNHRVLLVDHTGTQCGWCPTMMKALREVEADENYQNKFYEAMSHTFNNNDPSWSRSAEVVTNHYGSLVAGYPALTFNFYHTRAADRSANDIKAQIDALWKKDGADAGIAGAATGGNTMVAATAEVKAHVTGDYRITAWLLEDGIYAPQAGTTDESYYTHNNSIRYIASSDPITGFDLGTIEAGKSVIKEMSLEIQSSKWVAKNLKVLFIVTGLNEAGKYEVVNLAMCPVNGSVSYDYKK